MNLIANSGIQYFTIPSEINLNDSFKMYFHEWFDVEDEQLKLEIAHNFSDDEAWVRKHDLADLGYLQIKDEEKDDKTIKKGTVTAKWEEIKEDFYAEGRKQISIETESPEESGCFKIGMNNCRWERFENRWLPFPFFTLGSNDKSEFGPINWCRFKLVPDLANATTKKYSLLLAFDTRTKFEQEYFEDEDLLETPVFANTYDRTKNFALCNNEFSLVDFCSKSKNCEWVDEYILDVFHNARSFGDLKLKKPKLSYLAQYIYIIRYIQQLNVLPRVTLFSDKNVAFGNVDLVVDIGNSRTCAVLFDDSDFTRVERLKLQNFTTPLQNEQLNRFADSFDMRLAFREADFGGNLIEGSSQFVFPSMIRLGGEANELIHKATNLNTGTEKITTFSSPKRYLWDNKPQQNEWEFITLQDEKSKSLWIKGISEQLNFDGSLNTDGNGGITTQYSRKALMTFAFLEILAQAKMQINSYEFRHKWGSENTPRRIGRVIVTCPTAMSRVEQIALRGCAEDAAIILERFYAATYYNEADERESRSQIKIIPSVKNLSSTENRQEWIYDEATSAQFVYLYAEVKERYRKNCGEYFDFYGKMRKDLGDYNKKSLTIGSVDIGAGTTDVMIAAYKYDDAGQCTLTPVPLFWESFYVAGDDMLKELVRQIIIEGQYAGIQKQLEKMGKAGIAKLILDFFGKDNARQSLQDRQIRSEFNLQVAVPVVSRFLELLNENKVEKAIFSFEDVFTTIRPTQRVLEHFTKHFGFSIETLQWNYDKEILSKIVERTF
ncbi:MAG TPA: virulence factor SrfB, partial [Chitinophagaceae bacterium]|nr:virulence factor SrfB [Chitinophagaceae bacterium]